MKSTWLLLLTFALLAPALAADASKKAATPKASFLDSLLPLAMQRHPELDLIVVGEVTKAGQEAMQPTVEQPAYYVALTEGYAEMGDTVAGENPPPARELQAILNRTLSSAHYLPATNPHAPTLLLVFHWGSLNMLNRDLLTDQNMSSYLSSSRPGAASRPSESGPDTTAETSVDARTATGLTNLTERISLVGGAKYLQAIKQGLAANMNASGAATASDFIGNDPKIGYIMDAAAQDRYFVIVSAYDYAAARQREKRLLWITKMSTNSRGVDMRESLPALAVAGGPAFGRQTDGPIFVQHPLMREGHVNLGPLEIIEENAKPAKTPVAKP